MWGLCCESPECEAALLCLQNLPFSLGVCPEYRPPAFLARQGAQTRTSLGF